ncbi:MAG: aldehyde-activating protein [Cyanobacteriota bacterium]
MNLSCHCGNVKISVNEKPETLTSCNCSLCHRYGSLWGYYKPEEVLIKFEKEKTNFYIWGDKCIESHHCTKCGCLTHYTTTEKVDPPKIGVNFRMADLTEIQDIRIRKLDGRDTWKFID